MLSVGATNTVTLFNDETLQNEILHNGYAVRDFIGEQEIQKLYEGFLKIDAKIQDKPQKFWPSGRSADPEIRNMAKKFSSEVLDEKFGLFFESENVTLMGGTYLYKPPTAESQLYPHQDASISDEKNFLSIYAWVPLCDVNESNGCMFFLPKSHLVKNYFRSLNVPWVFEGLAEQMLPAMTPVKMKAGEVLFFHSMMVHASPANLSTVPRVAVNYFIKSASAKFLHPYIGDDTPRGKVELFEINPDFYYKEDFMQRPAPKYPFVGFEDASDAKHLREEMKKLCRKENK